MAKLWSKGNPRTLLMGLWISAATTENSMKIPPKIKTCAAIWFRNFTSGYLPEKNKNINLKRYIYPYAHCSITNNSHSKEVSINKWMDKENMTYIIEYYSIKKKYCHLQQHDGTRGYHAKWNKSDRERQVYDLTYMWNLKTQMRKRNKMETYLHRWRTSWCLPKGRGRGMMGRKCKQNRTCQQ